MKHPKPGPSIKNSKTKADRDHLNLVASQPCSIKGCEAPPCVHHIRILGEPRDHFRTIPLCYLHHQGSSGIHFMGKHAWREKFGHELDMLAELMERKDAL